MKLPFMEVILVLAYFLWVYDISFDPLAIQIPQT